MSDFHRSLDAALHFDPADHCPDCGCRLRDNRLTDLKPCPMGCDDRSAA